VSKRKGSIYGQNLELHKNTPGTLQCAGKVCGKVQKKPTVHKTWGLRTAMRSLQNRARLWWQAHTYAQPEFYPSATASHDKPL